MILRARRLRSVVAAVLAISGSGCSQKEGTEPGVIDYMSGAEQLKTYQKARTQIEDLGKAVEARGREIQ